MRFQSTKTYTHAEGFSCCFRQWRATSHCRFLHGYALQIEITFEGPLDTRNWVVDFGALKPLKEKLKEMFDHKLIIAEDDPRRYEFSDVQSWGVADIRIAPATGAEAFAREILSVASSFVNEAKGFSPDVFIYSVKVSEHPTNSATVINERR